MALSEMIKARVAVHKSVADELASKLQELGCCEFVAASGEAKDGKAVAGLLARQRRIEELLSDVRFATRLLETMEKNKESSIARMLGDIPEISFGELAAKADETKFTAFVRDLRDKERALTECRAEIARYKGLVAQTELLEAIKYPLEFFTKGTEQISGIVVSITKPASSQFGRLLSESLGDYFELQELPGGPKEASVVFALLFRKEEQEKALAICNELSAARIEVPKDFELTAALEKEKFASKAAELEKSEAALDAELAARADEGLAMARYGGDYWNIEKNRLNSMLSAVSTGNVLFWSLWMPEEKLPQVKETVGRYDPLIDFAVVEPDEDEIPPSLLRNQQWVSCMEPLTLMYGTPTYGTCDPSMVMAPFFFVILGMCFGDAGYGLLLSGIFGYFLIKHQMSPTLRKFFVILFGGMLCTVAFGFISGSFFGDSIDAFPFLSMLTPLKDKIQLIDPLNDPMTLLVISLCIGFVQIMVGLALAFHGNWSRGDRFAALADNGGWMFFLIAVVLYGLSASGSLPGVPVRLAKYAVIAGILLLIATQGRDKASLPSKIISGVLSLYNVTGYMGDVLSYSRILALGLGSAAVGMVLNLLAVLLTGIPYVGIFLAALVFAVGHIFSIAVNLLGAFIHTLRLQYVEFFGKFYDANGRDFAPLNRETKYARIVGRP